MRRLRAAISPAHLLLGLILLAGLVLRLRHNEYGLPYVYNVDEGSHFTSRAVEMLGGDPSPGYFQNPSAFTYLVHAALRVRFGVLGDLDVVGQFKADPTQIYDLARSLSALLCLAGVIAVYWVGRRLWGTAAGLAAAAVLCFAFLPVAYSRIAVTDVGTLAPVAIAVYAAVRAREDGRLAHYALAGGAGGLAIGFKYTAGLVLLPLLLAAVLRAREDRLRALGGAALGVALALLAFFVTTPFFFLDFDDARRQLEAQADTAGDFAKLGQADDSGVGYYLESLTWGLGWGAAAAALAGAVLEARRHPRRTLLLVAFPLALFVYLTLQSRYFGRWLLPAYPVLALLAGVALARVAALSRPALRVAVLTALCLAVLAQPLAADVRTMRLLGRTDTRQFARDFLRERFPPRLRAVVEPAVPARWFRRLKPSLAQRGRKQFVRGFVRDIQESRIDYAATLRPETIDRYRETGFCVVVTMSVIRGRAENDGRREALDYYRRLERESDLLAVFEPYDDGAGPVRFHFDLSYNYYPSAFDRPGPEVRVYRLHDCHQGFGPVPKGTGDPT